MKNTSSSREHSTINPSEIKHFQKLAQTWWDESGPYKHLHKLNPCRIQFIRDQLIQHFNYDAKSSTPLKGLKLIDVGSGGGLVSEPLAKLGANILGLDAADENISVARVHAEAQQLNHLTYQHGALEHLDASHNNTYDAVIAMEIIEHVSDVRIFLTHCIRILKPGGILLLATLNRTPKSYALGIVAAEHILRWVPKRTHHWQQFLKPSEIAEYLRPLGTQISNIKGMVFKPFRNTWELNNDLSVNYILSATKEL